MLQRKKEIVEKIENIIVELNLFKKDIEGDKSVISKSSAVSNHNLSYKEVKTLLKFLNSICPSILEVVKSNLRDKVQSFRLDGQSYLVYGEVQSGKTNFLLGISMAHIILNRCPVIIVLRNSKEDADQLQNRFIDLVRKQKEECKIDHDSLQYFYLGENKSEEDLFRAVRECRIIVVIANKTQLNRLAKVLTPGVSYATVVDEADLVAYGEDDTDYRKVLHEGILSNSGRTYAITATTFNVIFTEKKIPSGNIIQLPTQQEYRGLEDIEMRIINPKNEDELQKHLEMLSRKNAYGRELNSSINKTDHPVIMLIKKFHRKLNQQELARQVVEIGNWTEVIVFNGDGLTLYSKYIEKLSEIIGDKIIGSDFIMEKKPVKMEQRDGKPCLVLKAHIYEGLQYYKELHMSSKSTRISHIAIVSDTMADRGISFVSRDYEWHLTCEYYQPSKNAFADNIIQSIRLCGNYQDDIPLVLYATEKVCKDLTKSFLFQKEILTRCKSSDLGKSIPSTIKRIPINRDKIPQKREFGVRPHRLKLVEGDDGGVEISEYSSIGVKEEFWIVKPPVDSKQLALYKIILKYLEDKKNSWIKLKELKNIQTIKVMKGVQINFHLGEKDTGSKGLLWRDGEKGEIEYNLTQ
jgi:hypothetical protein